VQLLLILALLAEPRAYRGQLIVRSEMRLAGEAQGSEVQEERIEFLLLTEALARGETRQPFVMRERSGSYRLAIDLRDDGVSTKGEGSGALHPEVEGSVDPATGDVELSVRVTPGRLLAKTIMGGFEHGRFRTYRSVADRRPFSHAFAARGKFDDEGVWGTSRTAEDRKEKYPRAVETTLRLERIDPVLRGVALDQHGSPLAGLRVVARTTDPGRIARRLPPLEREGKTDERGRFAIDAWCARWEIEIEGAVRGEHAIEGRVFREGVLLAIDDAPFTDARLSVFRIDALPEARALRGHFRDDLKGYFAYIRERASEERLALALAPAADG